MPVPQSDVGRRAYNDDRAHVFHSWSAQAELDPIVMESAHGSYIVDADNKEYIDFSSQLVYEYWPPAPEGRAGHQGAGGPTVHHRSGVRE